MMKTFVLATIIYFASSLLVAYAHAQEISPVASTICSSYSQLSNQNSCLQRLRGMKFDKDVVSICGRYNQANNREICAGALKGINIESYVVEICNRYNEAQNVQICALALKDARYVDRYAFDACNSYHEARNAQICIGDLANLEFEAAFADQCLQRYNEARNRQICLKQIGMKGLRVQESEVRTCDEYIAFAGQLRAEFDVDDELRANLIREILTRLNAKFGVCLPLLPGQVPPPGATALE